MDLVQINNTNDFACRWCAFPLYLIKFIFTSFIRWIGWTLFCLEWKKCKDKEYGPISFDWNGRLKYVQMETSSSLFYSVVLVTAHHRMEENRCMWYAWIVFKICIHPFARCHCNSNNFNWLITLLNGQLIWMICSACLHWKCDNSQPQ